MVFILTTRRKQEIARIREWEEVSKLDFNVVSSRMIHAALMFFYEYKDHYVFGTDLGRQDIKRFLKQVKIAMTASLHEYINHELGYSDADKKLRRDNWKKTEGILREAHRLLGRIPKENADQISAELKKHAFATLGDKVRSSIKRGLMISVVERRRTDTRGNKRSRVGVLACALFENLEWHLERDLARSFAITPSRRDIVRYPERNKTRDFVNRDAKLIYHVVKVVVPSAAIETVQSALKAMPSRKSEK